MEVNANCMLGARTQALTQDLGTQQNHESGLKGCCLIRSEKREAQAAGLKGAKVTGNASVNNLWYGLK